MKNILLDKIQDYTKLSQSIGEWRFYLEFIDAYFRNREIKKPIIVEIGIGLGKQKRFYKELLGYEHIGIDIRADRKPDIVGNSNDIQTLNKLKIRLQGHNINLLYIDGSHLYSALKKDYELYSPLAKNIIVIHDIVLEDLKNTCGRFWKELIAENINVQDKTFITFTGYCSPFGPGAKGRKYPKDILGQGTGLILLGEPFPYIL